MPDDFPASRELARHTRIDRLDGKAARQFAPLFRAHLAALTGPLPEEDAQKADEAA